MGKGAVRGAVAAVQRVLRRQRRECKCKEATTTESLPAIWGATTAGELSLSRRPPGRLEGPRSPLRPCCRGQIFSPEGLQPPPRVAVTVPRRGGSTSPPLRRVAHSWTRLGPTGVNYDEAVTPQPQLLLSFARRPPPPGHPCTCGQAAATPIARGGGAEKRTTHRPRDRAEWRDCGR